MVYMTKKNISTAPKPKKKTELSNMISHDKIHFEKLILRYSHLIDIQESQKGVEEILFRVTPRIVDLNLFLELHLKVVNIVCKSPFIAQQLTFGLIGQFKADEGMAANYLEDFAKNFTLALLWPYAREYTQDVFQRTGQVNTILPVLNVQDTTKEMIEKGQITVMFGDGSIVTPQTNK
jgi:hypothetical protein